MALSQKLNYNQGQLAAYSVLGSGYWYISNYDQALAIANKGKALAIEAGNSNYLSNNLIAIGLVNSVTGKYEEAFLNYFEALDIAEDNKLMPTQARVLNNIAYLYIATGDNNEAIAPLEKAIEINKVIDNETRMAVYLNNLGGGLQEPERL